MPLGSDGCSGEPGRHDQQLSGKCACFEWKLVNISHISIMEWHGIYIICEIQLTLHKNT